MTEPYSAGSPTVLAWFDPDMCSWRMSQQSLLGEAELLERLPNWGMTQNLELFELRMPAGLINDLAGSVSLATPTAWLGRRPGNAQGGKQLAEALLPTPNAGLFNDSEDPATWQERRDRQNNYAGTPLPIAVKTLPTPRAQNGETRNMNVWERPLDQPQNLENALARLNGETTDQPLNDGNESSDE